MYNIHQKQGGGGVPAIFLAFGGYIIYPISTVYIITLGTRKNYIVKYNNYTPAKFINIFWSKTKCFMMSHIEYVVSEQFIDLFESIYMVLYLNYCM